MRSHVIVQVNLRQGEDDLDEVGSRAAIIPGVIIQLQPPEDPTVVTQV